MGAVFVLSDLCLVLAIAPTGFWLTKPSTAPRTPPLEARYVEAQKLLAEYQNNLGIVANFKTQEAESAQAPTNAERNIQQLLATTPDDPEQVNNNRTAAALQGIINDLDKVKPNTTSHAKAQELRGFADQTLKQLQ